MVKIVLVPLQSLKSTKFVIYASKLNQIKPSIQERIAAKASTTWLTWEQAQGGWKKKVVQLGNKAINNIDYREHALKTIWSESSWNRAFKEDEKARRQVVAVHHPNGVSMSLLPNVETLAKEGYTRHRSKMFWALAISPLTLPFALVPIVPNLPGIYVMYRAWCHWRAMQGSSHLLKLLSENRLETRPSNILDELYDKSTSEMQRAKMTRVFEQRLEWPELSLEIERACRQLEVDSSKAQVESDLEGRVEDRVGARTDTDSRSGRA